ncbi:MAG: carboxypeptidase regulatory-like domain-containing protein, partial [Terriglobia bacterium]
LKPFPRFTTVSLYRNNVGNTNYHSLQVRLEKRWDAGLAFRLSYTRSKLIDEASSVFDASILAGPVANFPVADGFNRKLERDVSTGDLPNAFAASWTYELPFGLSHRVNPTGFIGKFASGWQLAGVVTLQSGLPVAVSQATNFNGFAGYGTQRPNCIARPELPGSQRTTARFFNTDAFQTAPQFTLGSCSRNPLRGPGYRTIDLALMKRIGLTENLAADFRAEVYNLTNTPPIGNPASVLGAAGFGAIASAGDPRVIQLAFRLSF